MIQRYSVLSAVPLDGTTESLVWVLSHWQLAYFLEHLCYTSLLHLSLQGAGAVQHMECAPVPKRCMMALSCGEGLFGAGLPVLDNGPEAVRPALLSIPLSVGHTTGVSETSL